jgi:hypothetical protein
MNHPPTIDSSFPAAQPLPPGWRIGFTKENQPFYINDLTVIDSHFGRIMFQQ